MDKYDPEKKVDLVVDEWGGWYNVAEGTNPGFLYQQNTMRDAMIAGMTLNIFNNHADRVKMANLAQTVNVLQAVILTEGEKLILTPTYHILKMFKVHQDAQLIPVDFNAPEYVYQDMSLPALSVSASKDTSGSVHVSLVNIDAHNSNTVRIDLSGLNVDTLKGTILSSEALQDHNTFDHPDKIAPREFKEFKLRKGIFEAELPPFSVVVLDQE
jgi:alpha-N-arabinofuranosidase